MDTMIDGQGKINKTIPGREKLPNKVGWMKLVVLDELCQLFHFE